MEAGQLADARRIWVLLLQAEPQNEAIWLRYVASFPDRAGQLAACDRWLERSAHSWAARQAKARLQATRPPGNPPLSPAAAVSRRPWRWLVALGLLLGILALAASAFQLFQHLQAEYQFFASQNQVLATDKSALEAKVAGLTTNYNNLSVEMEAVQQAYGNLLSTHNTLVADYNTLFEQHATLQASYNTLQDEHEALWQSYNTAVAQVQFYEETAVTPPYIQIEDQVIYLVFFKTDGSLTRWPIPFEWLEESVRQGYDARNGFFSNWNTLSLTTVTGETVQVMDFSDYVDPEPFRAYVADSYYQAPSEEAFVYEMWYLVSQLTSYAYEIQETPRVPLETLLSGGGDCEDTAILLASLLKAAPVAWEVEMVYMDADSPQMPYTANHVVVYLNTGWREYLIETTSDYEMQPWPADTQGWYLALN
jgi:hypothetical protein